MLSVKLAATADEGIAAQVEWYRANQDHGGEVLARRWFDRLYTALVTLSQDPFRHGLAPENGKWVPQHQLRQMVFRPWKSGVGWRVLFVIDEDKSTVTVLQVRHERRRWMHEADGESK